MTSSSNRQPESLNEILDWLIHPTRAETEIYLVRHGRTAANANRLMVGSTDVPLDDHGVAQARSLGTRMRALAFDALISSPMLRARQTAQAISDATGRPFSVVPGLEEMDCGDAEGLTLDEIATMFPEIAPLLDDLDDESMSWPGGEGRLEFHERILATFLGILGEYVGQTVVVVCHGGIITSLMARLHGGSPNDFVEFGVGNCSITHIHVGPDGTRVFGLNDQLHLEEIVTVGGS